MAQNYFSTGFGFGDSPDNTGAPGGGDISQTMPGTGQTGAPANAGTTQAVPQDLVTPTPHSHVENLFAMVDQSGMAHGGVEASQIRPAFGADGMQTDTGAGSGEVGHSHTGGK